MSAIIRENNVPVTATVATDKATSTEIDMRRYAMGRFHVPAGSALTTITWYSSPTAGGTYLPAYDELGVSLAQTVAAGRSYTLPSEMAAGAFIKPEGNAAGTITIVLKG